MGYAPQGDFLSFYTVNFLPSRIDNPGKNGYNNVNYDLKGGNTMDAGSNGNIPGRSSSFLAALVGL